MTYLSLRQTQLQTDLLATDLLPECPECPGCHELCPAGATVCAECGTRLFVGNSNGPGRSDLDGTSAAGAEEVSVMEAPYDCSCGGRGICTACVVAEYEGDTLPQRMMATALDATVAALTAPVKPTNVVELPGHSKKVS